jgi:hypothetical protein
MVRFIVAWILLILGLVFLFEGLARLYAASVFADVAPKDQVAVIRTAAGIPIAVGVVLLLVGAILRSGGRAPRETAAGTAGSPRSGTRKRVCPACGGRSPAAALECYHCGKNLPRRDEAAP